MPESRKDELISTVDRLHAELASLPPSEAIQRAMYQCERLRLAIVSSHSEGTRFAAFTVNKILRDRQSELTPSITDHLQQIRSGLVQLGVEL